MTLKGATKLLQKIYLCVHQKSKRERNQLFKILFFKINIHFGTSN